MTVTLNLRNSCILEIAKRSSCEKEHGIGKKKKTVQGLVQDFL